MKNLLNIMLCWLLASGAYGQEFFYYASGEKIPITIDDGHLFASFEEKENLLNQIDGIGEFSLKTDMSSGSPYYYSVIQIDNQSRESYQSIKTTLNDVSTVIRVQPCFFNENNVPLGMSDYLYVKLKEEEHIGQLKQIAALQGLEIIEQNKFMPLWYTLRCTKSTLNNTLIVANTIYETGLFLEAIPDFLSEDIQCTNDPEMSNGNLWGLDNQSNPNIDVNACAAWSVTKGENTVVAILDQGIEKSHNDLNDNLYPLSYDSESNTSPSKLFDDHGTHVAGTVGAEIDNGLQVVGLSPKTKLMDVSNSLGANANSRIKRADGINWAWQNGADVINNSWHSGVVFPVINDAIQNALTNGRNGKGTVVVFAAGNNGGAVSYPANAIEGIVTVGSIDRNGSRSSFSNYGSELDVVAPGRDILSTLPGNTIGSYNGTSMAAPHVAGLAALIISVNPNLTQRQVVDIIESTTQKVGGAPYANTSGRNNGTWDNQMGYGLINAEAAVKAAGADLHVRTAPDDDGNIPYTGHPWRSPDIWIGDENNPSNPQYGFPSEVSVRVHNRGTQPYEAGELVELRWSKANTANGWRNGWDGSSIINTSVEAGNIIGTAVLPDIAPGASATVTITWNDIPDPDDYDGLTDDNHHFCLLARVLSTGDPITEPANDPTYVGFYVADNNNVAWRNVIIQGCSTCLVWSPGDDCPKDVLQSAGSAVAITNPMNTPETFDIQFSVPADELTNPITNNGVVLVALNDELYQKWVLGGKQGTGFNEIPKGDVTGGLVSNLLKGLLGDNSLINLLFPNRNDLGSDAQRNLFEITEPTARFNNITLSANDYQMTTMGVVYPTQEVSSKDQFRLDITQIRSSDNVTVGGLSYDVLKPDCSALEVSAGDVVETNRGCDVLLSASPQNNCSVYRWTDEFGNEISTESEIEITALRDRTINLMSVSMEGCLSATQTRVDVGLGLCTPTVEDRCFANVVMSPNPSSSNTFAIELNAANTVEVSIKMTNVLFGNVVKQVDAVLNAGQNVVPVDISNIPRGLYNVTIQCPDNSVPPFTGLFSKQ